MKKICAFFSILICLLLGVVSCKPSLPGDVLSKGKMADILYDYHVALSMAHTADGGDTGQSITYREAVLRKHDVTSAEFDSSMVYYMRHTELLEDVYKELDDRLNNEIVALGGNADASQFDNLSATGDTANVWNQAPAMVLSATKPFNAVSFDIPVDTAFHKGDRLMLDLIRSSSSRMACVVVWLCSPCSLRMIALPSRLPRFPILSIALSRWLIMTILASRV